MILSYKQNEQLLIIYEQMQVIVAQNDIFAKTATITRFFDYFLI